MSPSLPFVASLTQSLPLRLGQDLLFVERHHSAHLGSPAGRLYDSEWREGDGFGWVLGGWALWHWGGRGAYAEEGGGT